MPRRDDKRFTRRDFMRLTGAGAMAAGTGAVSPRLFGAEGDTGAATDSYTTVSQRDFEGAIVATNTVAAEPTKIPGPIGRRGPKSHDIELVAQEVEAQLASGSTHRFMTFNGQVPGPMIRVRRGDTINLTFANASDSSRPHNVDFHAVYGSGGGAAYTTTAPGQTKKIRFKAMYPGAFIYHCAVPNLDEHISRGMFGMIVVEPEDGLPEVDREFYVGQHELYTKGEFRKPGDNAFAYEDMKKEIPTYVLFNGAVTPFTTNVFGPMQAKRDETIRVFMVNGGPNLTSGFHPIGNIWSRMWPQGSLASDPLRYVQTYPTSPGSCLVGDMELPVPETIKLVDHALTRFARKGLLSEIQVTGEPNPEVFEALS